jgi:hypothetical protein
LSSEGTGIIENLLPFVQEAAHPDFVVESSDFHTMSMMPVNEVTGLGMVEPEYASSSTVFKVHDTLMQLLSVSVSKPSCVSKDVKLKVMAAGDDIITDKNSEFP